MTKRNRKTTMNMKNMVTPKESGENTSCAWLSLFLLLYVFLPAFILSVFLLLRVDSPAMAYWCSLAVLLGLLLTIRNKTGTIGRLAAWPPGRRLHVFYSDSYSRAHHFMAFFRCLSRWTGISPTCDSSYRRRLQSYLRRLHGLWAFTRYVERRCHVLP